MKFLKIAKTMFVIAMFIRCFIFLGIAGSLELDNITVGEAFIRALANGSGLLIEIFLLKLTEQLIWEREDREKKMSKSEKIMAYPLRICSNYDIKKTEEISKAYSAGFIWKKDSVTFLFKSRKDRGLCARDLRKSLVLYEIAVDMGTFRKDLVGGEDFEGI